MRIMVKVTKTKEIILEDHGQDNKNKRNNTGKRLIRQGVLQSNVLWAGIIDPGIFYTTIKYLIKSDYQLTGYILQGNH